VKSNARVNWVTPPLFFLGACCFGRKCEGRKTAWDRIKEPMSILCIWIFNFSSMLYLKMTIFSWFSTFLLFDVLVFRLYRSRHSYYSTFYVTGLYCFQLSCIILSRFWLSCFSIYKSSAFFSLSRSRFSESE